MLFTDLRVSRSAPLQNLVTSQNKSNDRAKFDFAFQRFADKEETDKSEPSKKTKRLENDKINSEEEGLLKKTKTEECKPQTTKNPYAKIYYQASLNKIVIIGNRTINIDRLAHGSYSFVYKINTDQATIIPGMNNDRLVIKIFNETMVRKKNEVEIRRFADSSLRNYKSAMEIHLPVAKIFNLETALEDKYFIQEKIPGKFDFKNESHRNQLHIFFLASLTNKLMLDLHPGNLLVHDNNQLTLIDFVEDESRGIAGYINTALNFWCSKGVEKMNWDRKTAAGFLSELTKDFEKYDVKLEDNEIILDRIFKSSFPTEPY